MKIILKNDNDLMIQPITVKDKKYMINILSDSKNTILYFRKKKSPKEIGEHVDYILNSKSNRELYLGIYYESQFVGLIGLVKKNLYRNKQLGEVATVSIIIDRNYQKKKIAYTVLRTLFGGEYIKKKLYRIFGFKIYSSIYDENKRSLGLFTKLGFKSVIHIDNISIMMKNILEQKKYSDLYKNITNEDINVNINGLQKMGDEIKISDIISYYIYHEKIEYPYQKKFMRDPKKLFNNLKNYKMKYREDKFKLLSRYRSKYGDKKVGYIISDHDYENINILSDFFQEKCRLKCKRHNQKYAPVEHWNNPKLLRKILQEMIIKKINITNYEIREYFYNNIRECNAFKITVARCIYILFKAKRILDISSGWGDRLLAAMSLDEKIEYYNGTDPNTCTHKNYIKIINYFNMNPKKYNIQNLPFEEAIFNKTYNVIFTSPPYFNLEKYTDETSQSMHSHENLHDWIINFLFYSLKKAWDLLEMDGHMIISIEDVPGTNYIYTEPMILYINSKLKFAHYIGVVGHTTGDDNPICRPMYVWKKINKINIEQIKYSTQMFKKYYNKIFSLL